MALLTLDEAKAQLNITGTGSDTEITAYVNGLTAAIEGYCGEVEQVNRTDRKRPVSCYLALNAERIASVTTVTEFWGTVGHVCTEATTPAGAGTYTYLLDPRTPVLTRVAAGGLEIPWQGFVEVDYVAGFATVPDAIDLAARLTLQHLWETQRGAMALPLQGQPELAAPTPQTILPRRVLELLSPYQRTSGAG